jgi:hypothetical protein
MASKMQVDQLTNSAGTAGPSFPLGFNGTAPTVQKFTATGAFTYTPTSS